MIFYDTGPWIKISGLILRFEASGLLQRQFQIKDEVLDILQANGDPDEVVHDSGIQLVLRSQLSVGRGDGVHSQAVVSSEAGSS